MIRNEKYFPKEGLFWRVGFDIYFGISSFISRRLEDDGAGLENSSEHLACCLTIMLKLQKSRL
jgi:hypothetical protein